MFSGIGGFDLALERHGHECIGYSEIDKYAIKVYENHFPKVRNYGDATKINPAELPEFELLCGGFPCQSFSIAGKRGGFEDTRGTLFFEIARVCKERRPKLLLLENVKGLLSHDGGRTFGTILHTLGELGYWWEYEVLNSKNFGVPQNRERVFVVGHLAGTGGGAVFPLGESHIISDEAWMDKPIFSALTSSDHKGISKQRPNAVIMLNDNNSRGFSVAEPFDGIRLHQPNSKTARARVIKQASHSLQTSGSDGVLLPDMKIRRLTEVECERLQGFPDGWTEGISSTQRYKCLGNAVTVNVVEEIVKRF